MPHPYFANWVARSLRAGHSVFIVQWFHFVPTRIDQTGAVGVFVVFEKTSKQIPVHLKKVQNALN